MADDLRDGLGRLTKDELVELVAVSWSESFFGPEVQGRVVGIARRSVASRNIEAMVTEWRQLSAASMAAACAVDEARKTQRMLGAALATYKAASQRAVSYTHLTLPTKRIV